MEATEERASDRSGAHLATRVADLTDADLLATGAGVDIEAEEARKAFWAARKAVVKKAGKRAAAAEAKAAPAPVVTGWRAKLDARKGAATGKVDIQNAVLFPTLERAASGL